MNRSVASTLMNSESSRSHSIFTITVETAETGVDNKDHIRVGKMNMVDLAGSERQSKTGASGDTLKEATKINMSLSALGNVISALVDSKSGFIPYRDSKLTRLLQDSLGGNTKTVMCANCGPVDYNYDETLSTLRYAYRAKSIKNKPRINEDPKDAMIREFQDEIARLKARLQEQASGGKTRSGGPKRAGGGGGGGAGGEQKVIVEKVVQEVEHEGEKEVVVEKIVNRGITEGEMAEIQAKVEEERQEMEKQLDQERRDIENQLGVAEEEKQRLLQELQERERKKEEEAAAHEYMLEQIQAMEKAMQQEAELRKAAVEVEERVREEKRVQEALEQQQEEKLTLEEKYSSADEQVQKMTAKLEKLWHRNEQCQAEVQDIQQEFQREKDDMLETIRDLTKEVKLVTLTIEQFVPMEHYQQIVSRAYWDEANDEWTISRIDRAGNRIRPQRKQDDRDDSPGALLRGTSSERPPQPDPLTPEQPNVYFVYTEDGSAQRAESRSVSSISKATRTQRMKSAGRPGTASRKGRTVKSNQAGADATMTNNFGLFHSPEPEADDADMRQNNFPRARGLVK